MTWRATSARQLPATSTTRILNHCVLSQTASPRSLRSRWRRFRASKVKEIIGAVLKAKLSNVTYHGDNTSLWCREIADEIKGKLKTMGLERYKFVVQVGSHTRRLSNE